MGSDGLSANYVIRSLMGRHYLQHLWWFLGTNLEEELRGLGTDSLVVAGMMTSMCVDATVRAASDLGFEVTLAHDACAAPDLEFGGVEVPAAAVGAAFLAALADSYGSVVSSASFEAP